MPKPKFGATGQFPFGKLNEHDEGELNIGVAADLKQRTVILNFGTPVVWTAFPPELARQLAELLIKNAEKCERRTT
jgi:hypothetical protein